MHVLIWLIHYRNGKIILFGKRRGNRKELQRRRKMIYRPTKSGKGKSVLNKEQIWDVRHCAVRCWECGCVFVFARFWVVALGGLTSRQQLQWTERGSEFSQLAVSPEHTYPDGGVVGALLCMQQRSRATACAELQLQAAVFRDGSAGVLQGSCQQHISLVSLTQAVVQTTRTVQR